MSPTHEPFDEMAAAHALDALDGEDLARFRAHLAQACGECERRLADYHEALVRPAADLREPPPPGAGRALTSRLARTRGHRRGPPRFWPGLEWVASVAVAAALVASVVTAYVSARYEMRLGRMAREAVALRGQIGQQREALALLRDPATRVISLAGLDPSPKAQGRVIWNERQGGVFVAADLPPAPRDKTYELWAIAGARPVPAGLFAVDAEGRGSARVAPLAGGEKVDRFAVTLEPAAGAPAPTGPMYLASK